MQFTPWNAQLPKIQKLDRERFRTVDDIITEMPQYGGENRDLLLLEELWLSGGSPYYNVHPLIVPHLCNVNLDDIPLSLLEMPDDMAVLNVRFAGSNPEFTFTEKTKMGDVPRRHQVFEEGAAVTNMLMVKRQAKFEFFLTTDQSWGPEAEQKMGFVAGLPIVEGESIAWSLGQQPNRVIENAVKLCVVLGFLRNSNQKLITPDVLSKDRRRYETATPEQQQTIEAKARRRGKVGWNVGNDIMFLPDSPTPNGSTPQVQGRELSHAHIRKGHFHAVRYGPGRTKVKLMWFRPTTVRPDKPFKILS